MMGFFSRENFADFSGANNKESRQRAAFFSSF
jgi:hypothetical protein